MVSSRPVTLLAVLVATCAFFSCDAFTMKPQTVNKAKVSSTAVYIGNFGGGKKKPTEDLSYIESRDMTKEEMLELNKKNEDIMNMELQAMTGFSLVLSLPILYLCWVAFFSD